MSLHNSNLGSNKPAQDDPNYYYKKILGPNPEPSYLGPHSIFRAYNPELKSTVFVPRNTGHHWSERTMREIEKMLVDKGLEPFVDRNNCVIRVPGNIYNM